MQTTDMDWEAGLKRGPFTETQINQLIELVPGLDAGQVQWLNGYLTAVSLSREDIVLPPQERPDIPAREQPAKGDPVWILYGTHTGNAEKLAAETARRLKEAGREMKVAAMGSFKTRELKKIGALLVIVSTDGEGEPPPDAEELHGFLMGGRAFPLPQLRYSVLALGDTSYTCFCQTGKDFDAAFGKLGAGKLAERVDCDVDYEEGYEQWIKAVLAELGSLSVRRDGVLVNAVTVKPSQPAPAAVYDRKHPFSARVLNKINLNGRHSSKETLHLELDLEGSGLRYEAGDALGVYAGNPPELIEPILTRLGLTGEEPVGAPEASRSLRTALEKDFELTPLTAYSLSRYAALTGDRKLQQIASDKASAATYVRGRDIYDLIGETPHALRAEQLVSVLRSNTARMYSIASSQQAVGDQVHITVSVVRYESYGRCRQGHCSSFLSGRTETGDRLPVFIDSNTHFRLPAESDRPIIMVGAGTGVAPYRAFLQEREMLNNPGKAWLFFGDRNFTTDFLYQTEWLGYLKDGLLTRADVAFSRDQEEKLYVQHRMLEQGKDMFGWLEEGAHFYVCGDKSRMAKDVDAALRQIVRDQGGMTEEKAAAYVKSLRQQQRYQTDVY